ncbi:MAG: YceI family protein [Gemmatimonadaceae bacterium]
MATTTQAPGATSSWNIDASHSHIEFAVKHLMISTVKGRFADVEGQLAIVDGNPSASSVSVVIKAATIDTRTEQRDEHLRSADFLDVGNFPEITFKSTRIEGDSAEFKVTGDLTIRGVTKEITLDATSEGQGKDPWGGERIGFSAKTKFDRRDWGLQYNQALEAGGVVVGHEVKVSIELEAVKQA